MATFVAASPVLDRVFVAGAGITGALCSAFLSRGDLSQNSVPISIWDKSRGAGGRMSTSRTPKSSVTADLGAQYFTAVERLWAPDSSDLHRSIYDELAKAGILRTIAGAIEGDKYNYEKQKLLTEDAEKNGDMQHFVATDGSSTVVKYFLNQAKGTEVTFQRTIKDVSLTVDGLRWRLTTSDGESGEFPIVVLTMPVPQILGLSGDITQAIDGVTGLREKLKGVSYSSRYAMAVWYGPEVALEVDWAAKYLYDDDIIRYLAIDPKKRGNRVNDGTSVVVHTTVPFGIKHLEDDIEEVKLKIMDRLKIRFPEIRDAVPVDIKCHRWRYSQVHRSFAETPGCVVVRSSPLLILAGDGFVSASHFDGCVDGAAKVTSIIQNSIKRDQSEKRSSESVAT